MHVKTPEVLIEDEVLSPARLAALFPDTIGASLLQHGALVPDKAGAMRLRFVGVVVAADRAYQVMPKVLSSAVPNAEPAMRHVVRALRRYGRGSPTWPDQALFLSPSGGDKDTNALALADWIIADYLANGVYRRLRERDHINGDGLVNWRRTIERSSPILSSGYPIYLETINRTTQKDHDYFVSRLHRTVVDQATKAFGHLLGYAPISLDQEPFQRFPEMPDRLLSQSRLRREMVEAYSDRALLLLPILLAWLGSTSNSQKVTLSLYGTTTFYHVWESVCALLLGNKRSEWQASIPRPRWISAHGQVQTADTFEPDIVTDFIHGAEKHLLIADAKYYRLSMPPYLSGQPGINDIAKQLWYQKCLARAARQRGFAQIHNVFLLPGPEREAHFWSDGTVALDGLDETEIAIKRLSTLNALRRYADGSPLDEATLKSVILTGA